MAAENEEEIFGGTLERNTARSDLPRECQNWPKCKVHYLRDVGDCDYRLTPTFFFSVAFSLTVFLRLATAYFVHLQQSLTSLALLPVVSNRLPTTYHIMSKEV